MGARGRPAIRVRTDENVPAHSRTGIVGKTFGVSAATTTTTTVVKETLMAGGAVRPIVGKVIGGLKGGARRAALGDISNAGPSSVLTPRMTLLIQDHCIT